MGNIKIVWSFCDRAYYHCGFPVMPSVLICWKVLVPHRVAPHKPPLEFPWSLSTFPIIRIGSTFPGQRCRSWISPEVEFRVLLSEGASASAHLHLCRRGAREGEMLGVEVFYHPIWVFFTAVLAAVVYLQRRWRWDPKVCSVRLEGKVAVVTGANTGQCHVPRYRWLILSTKFFSGCNMNLFISDLVIMLHPVLHLLSLNYKLTSFSGCLFPPFCYLDMYK